MSVPDGMDQSKMPPEMVKTPFWGWVNMTAYSIYWAYDPKLPKPYWHRNLGLTIMCIAYGLSCVKLVMRFQKDGLNNIKGLKTDDWCMLFAGIVIIFPLWVSQAIRYGHGYGFYTQNLSDEDYLINTKWGTGKSTYYFVTSLIKIAVCLSYLEIAPIFLKNIRLSIWIVIALNAIVGLVYTTLFIFYCLPIRANFDGTVLQTACLNDAAFRFTWIGISTVLDIAMLIIPFLILTHARLRSYQTKVLQMVFLANLIGTLALLFSTYGAYTTLSFRGPWNDGWFNRVDYDICNYIEILAYTFGACFPIFSAFLIKFFKENEDGNYKSSISSSDLDTSASASKISITPNKGMA